MNLLFTQYQAFQLKDVQNCYLCGSTGETIIAGHKDRLFGVPGTWHYKRCSQCGLYWLTPWPQDLSQAYINYYTHQAPEHAVKLTIQPKSIKKNIAVISFGYQDSTENLAYGNLFKTLSLLGPLRDIAGRSVMWLKGHQRGKLLDVGCGNGSFLEQMQELGWDVYGVEPDGKAAESAKQRLACPEKIFHGFLENAGFNNGQFDVITMSHVIEHLPDPILTLKECRRILRLDGQLVVTTPNAEGLGKKIFKRNWRGWEPPRHLFLFNKEALRKCALDAGFKTAKVAPHATTAFDIWRAGWLPNKAGVEKHGQKPSHSKLITLTAIFFWLCEYAANKVYPVGEELVLTAIAN